jgi:NAD(P)-dependent dehydrogenase (short-subunit alcohol dehydrogenase family)
VTRADPAAAGEAAPFRLDGQVVIVTGASSGIGRHLAGVLAGAGATVVAAARRAAELARLAAEHDGRVVPVRCDVTDAADRDGLVAAALGVSGRIDVLVSNAGWSPQVPAAQLSAGEFEQVLAVNLTAGFALAAAVAGPMTDAGGGSIVFMASVMGLVAAAPLPLAAYCAAKGGLVALTRQLACEWAAAGIRVNAVAPGWFPSELTSEMFEDAGSMRWLVRNTPMRRTGELRELDGPVLLLASAAGSFVTGQVLAVDGGWTAR